jgi:hypothetical protein
VQVAIAEGLADSRLLGDLRPAVPRSRDRIVGREDGVPDSDIDRLRGVRKTPADVSDQSFRVERPARGGTMKSFLSWFDSFGKIVAGLTGLVLFVSGAVSLYFLLRPPPPQVQEATFDNGQLQQYGPPTTLRDYLTLAV